MQIEGSVSVSVGPERLHVNSPTPHRLEAGSEASAQSLTGTAFGDAPIAAQIDAHSISSIG